MHWAALGARVALSPLIGVLAPLRLAATLRKRKRHAQDLFAQLQQLDLNNFDRKDAAGNSVVHYFCDLVNFLPEEESAAADLEFLLESQKGLGRASDGARILSAESRTKAAEDVRGPLARSFLSSPFSRLLAHSPALSPSLFLVLSLSLSRARSHSLSLQISEALVRFSVRNGCDAGARDAVGTAAAAY
jgi:hypothetical protein